MTAIDWAGLAFFAFVFLVAWPLAGLLEERRLRQLRSGHAQAHRLGAATRRYPRRVLHRHVRDRNPDPLREAVVMGKNNPPPKCPKCGGNTSSEGQYCNSCKRSQ